MSISDKISLLNIAATVLALVAAPIIALWISGRLQIRTDSRKEKLRLMGILLSLRHQALSLETFRALNLIDVVFVDVPYVREAWSKYYAALNDQNLNNFPGYAVRDEKRRDLMIAIVECLGLRNRITTSDLLRAYIPTTAIEIEYLAVWERIKRREDLRAEFIARGIGFPDFQAPSYPPLQPSPAPTPTRKPSKRKPKARRNPPAQN